MTPPGASTGSGDARLRLRTFGALSLCGPEEGPPLLTGVKPLLIPAVLATLPGHEADRSHLAELIWGNGSTKKAAGSLRQALHHLTRFGEGAGLVVEGERVVLDSGRIRVDLLDFEEAVLRRDHEAVLRIHRGRFLESMERKVGRELQRWIDAQNDRVQIAVEVAYATLVEDRLSAGAVADALRYAEAYAAENPLSEKAQLTLVRVLRAGGFPGRALEVYHGFRSLLASELGGDLDPESLASVQRLHEEATREPPVTRVVYVEREGGSYEPRPSRVEVAAISAVASAGVLAAFWMLGGAPAPAPDPLGDLEARILVREGSEHRVLSVRGDDVELSDPLAVRPDALPSPDGRVWVAREAAEGGRDVKLVDEEGGFLRWLTGGPTDDYILDWSPDGRRVLVGRGSTPPGGGVADYRYVLESIEVASGRSDTLATVPFRVREAAWRPDGRTVALPIVDGDLFRMALVPVGGGTLRWVSPESVHAPYAAWSPDGRELAIHLGPEGASRIALWSAATGSLRDLELGPGPKGTPVWAGPGLLAYLGYAPDSTLVRLTELATGRSRTLATLTALAPAARLRRRLDPAPGPWIDSVVVLGTPERLTPGLLVSPRAEWVWSDGLRGSAPPGVIRWSVTEGDGTSVDFEESFVAGALGRVAIRAEIPGWRRTELVRSSVPLDSADVEPLMVEDWSDSLRADRWVPFGAPGPYVGPGTGGPTLRGNGDRNYVSGILSTELLHPREGLTVVATVTTPFSGAAWQDVWMGFAGEALPPEEGVATWSPPHVAWAHAHGASGTLSLGSLFAEGIDVGPGWHRLAVQVDREGVVAVVWDDRMVLRGPLRRVFPAFTLPDGYRVVLGANSDGTDVEIGPVTVYRGERYVLRDAPTERGEPLAAAAPGPDASTGRR